MNTTISRILKQFYNSHHIYRRRMKKNIDKINSFKSCTITGNGVKTQQGSQCLNDEAVNSYFQLVEK